MPVTIIEDKELKKLEKKVDAAVDGIERSGFMLLPVMTTVAATAAGEITKYICTITWVDPDDEIEEEEEEEEADVRN